MYRVLAEPPMDLGETLSGTLNSSLINTDKLGGIYYFDSKSTRDGIARVSSKPIGAVLLRNTSGLTLLGKRLGQLDRTAGYTPMHEVAGYSTVLANAGLVLIDPYLPSTGVADDDIFWGVFSGPALCLLPLLSTGHADISVNDPLVGHTGTTTGATTSGRITKVQFIAATSGETGAALQAFSMAKNVVGRALSARTSQETTAGADILVDFGINIWGG
jgi:hypothetical protein